MSEILRVLKPLRTRWLKPLKKYRVTVEYKSATEITDRTMQVSEDFGLGIDKTVKFPVYQDFEVDIDPTDVVYVCGDSGSGKSVLLRWFKKAFKGETVDVDYVKPDPSVPLVEQIIRDVQEALTLLSRAGLNDAFLFVRRFKEQSEGQKFRFKVAKMMESGRRFWVMDEFCSTLDRDTARIVAFNVQKLARKLGAACWQRRATQIFSTTWTLTCTSSKSSEKKPSLCILPLCAAKSVSTALWFGLL